MGATGQTSSEALLARALEGDKAALRELLPVLVPVVQARVGRALARRARATGRDPRQELRDMVQEVFLALLDDGARALRSWQKERGLSLENFVGLVAERQVATILRTGKRSPWTDEPTEAVALEAHVGAGGDFLGRLASREVLEATLDRLREELTPRMLHVFHALWIDELPVATLCEETGMTAEAVYMARSRIAKRAREIAAEVSGPPSSPRSPGEAS